MALLDQAPKPAVKKAKRKELEKNKKKFFPSTREKKVEGEKKKPVKSPVTKQHHESDSPFSSVPLAHTCHHFLLIGFLTSVTPNT